MSSQSWLTKPKWSIRQYLNYTSAAATRSGLFAIFNLRWKNNEVSTKQLKSITFTVFSSSSTSTPQNHYSCAGRFYIVQKSIFWEKYSPLFILHPWCGRLASFAQCFAFWKNIVKSKSQTVTKCKTLNR